MSRIAFVNGAYVPHSRACVHMEDRGYQFSDGVYEVWSVHHGRLRDLEAHLLRLHRSLSELEIPMPMAAGALKLVLREVVRRNRIRDGLVYLQISRGVAPRDHGWPEAGLRPTIVISARHKSEKSGAALAAKGVAVISLPDQRWARRDIKSVSLLANVLAKQSARRQGAFEAWLIDRDGYVTEGASSNAWIVTHRGELITRNLSEEILSGITRRCLLDIAKQMGLSVSERRFDLAEAAQSKEAFVTAATAFVMPVISLDGKPVGDGQPGKMAIALRKAYLALE